MPLPPASPELNLVLNSKNPFHLIFLGKFCSLLILLYCLVLILLPLCGVVLYLCHLLPHSHSFQKHANKMSNICGYRPLSALPPLGENHGNTTWQALKRPIWLLPGFGGRGAGGRLGIHFIPPDNSQHSKVMQCVLDSLSASRKSEKA